MAKNDPCKKRCKLNWDWIQKKMDREILKDFQKKFITILDCIEILDKPNKELNQHANTYFNLTLQYTEIVNTHSRIKYLPQFKDNGDCVSVVM